MVDSKTVRYGIGAAESAMSTQDRWPRLRPQENDRARFHFLTEGSDPWFHGTKFHNIGEDKQRRDVVCLHALTFGEEPCLLCEMDSSNRRNMFGCWVWLEYVLHPQDNPAEDGESWEQKSLAMPDGKKRTVFMEKVEEDGAARLLWLPAGRQKAWFGQFTGAWMASGNLRKHLYELHRVGKGRDDTNYTLTTIKEDPLSEEILKREEVMNLPSIEDIFRDTLRNVPQSGVLGTDSLDGPGEPEELPKEAAPAVADDDLI